MDTDIKSDDRNEAPSAAIPAGVSAVVREVLQQDKPGIPLGFLDFPGLAERVPLGERSLRQAVADGRIPSIRLPGGRRLLFFWPAVEKALLRFQRGEGVEQ